MFSRGFSTIKNFYIRSDIRSPRHTSLFPPTRVGRSAGKIARNNYQLLSTRSHFVVNMYNQRLSSTTRGLSGGRFSTTIVKHEGRLSTTTGRNTRGGREQGRAVVNDEGRSATMRGGRKQRGAVVNNKGGSQQPGRLSTTRGGR